MAQKKHLILFIVILVAIGAFGEWKKSVDRKALILANPPVEQPLFFGPNQEQTEFERQQSIDEYKAKILNRAKLKVPLTPPEKMNFWSILYGQGMSSSESSQVFADQSTLQFTEEELRLLSDAINYK